MLFKFLSSISHPGVCLVIIPNWRSSLHTVTQDATPIVWHRNVLKIQQISFMRECIRTVGTYAFVDRWWCRLLLSSLLANSGY